MKLTPIIEVRDVTYRYPYAEQPALDQISLQMMPNQWIAIVGHNGSGKSTLAKTFNGLIEPQSGEIYFDGQLLTEETVWDVRGQLGIVFQNPDNQFVGATVADDVAFGMENNGIPRDEMLVRVEAALRQVRMWDYRHQEPARLSGGQKQRVALAGVLAQRPKVIILDEATSMLDPQGRSEIIDLMSQLRAAGDFTIISITHDVDEAALADQIFLIDDGHLIMQGAPDEFFAKSDELHDHGLIEPLSEQIRGKLVASGINLSNKYLDENQLVDELWTLHLNM
ncbi:cobalt transporter ATP-binding subunit [Lapidilactobacillus concavus DSM 17758]|uniref:Cobalt transporter ATP-binding subunit n=1 Tax=Lapidilactobacillus concavus DSM 17758 TaxID=1423735 RepID=A0A0R1W556_9LACO|nr:cobalt transporter ATP-binding subunit [Lapidilactobacillus concavus DSM 17758]GEL13261.1 energy-coupling factor transporter ATP-binding protein EcfA1 [Lapidilactobacillus concavus]